MDEFNWEAFFVLLRDNQIIPIIGENIIKIETSNGEKPLSDLLSDRLAEKLNVPSNNLSLREFALQQSNNILFNRLIKPTYREIIEEIENESLKVNLLPLQQLAWISEFKIFLSTAFDDFLAKILIKERGADKVIIYNHSIIHNSLERRISENTAALVFNILGNIFANTNFARTEEEVLEYIYSLRRENQLTNFLFENIRGKNLLFLGCSFPDWLLRFFIRTISAERYTTRETLKYIADNSVTLNSKLNNFLSNFSVQVFPIPSKIYSDSPAFINDLYQRWELNTINKTPTRFQGTVFISYSRKDRDIVFPIFQSLKKRGVDVWFDESALDSGDVYDKIIEGKIKSCTKFIAFISSSVLDNPESYAYKIEWQIANARRIMQEDQVKNSFILPYIIDTTSLKDPRIPRSFRNILINHIDSVNIIDEIISHLNPI